jgi:hypothetical protein
MINYFVRSTANFGCQPHIACGIHELEFRQSQRFNLPSFVLQSPHFQLWSTWRLSRSVGGFKEMTPSFRGWFQFRVSAAIVKFNHTVLSASELISLRSSC